MHARGRVTIPRTHTVSGPATDAAMSSEAVSTSTVGPPAPPVVPFWPHAFTAAKPVGWPTTGGPGRRRAGRGVGAGGEVGGGLLGGTPLTVSTRTSSNEALA